MDAAEVITLADSMRAYALESGRDLNEANFFTHTMLMRKLVAEQNTNRPSTIWTTTQLDIESSARPLVLSR